MAQSVHVPVAGAYFSELFGHICKCCRQVDTVDLTFCYS